MNYKPLTENEQYPIYMMNIAEHSQKEIVELLKKSRALRRNRGLRSFRPTGAPLVAGCFPGNDARGRLRECIDWQLNNLFYLVQRIYRLLKHMVLVSLRIIEKHNVCSKKLNTRRIQDELSLLSHKLS